MATFWPVKHFAFIMGLAPLIIYSPQTPIQFLLSGQIRKGNRSNARLTLWALMLHDRGITMLKTDKPSYALLTPGESYEGSLPDTWLLTWQQANEHQTCKIFIDGSVYYKKRYF